MSMTDDGNVSEKLKNVSLKNVVYMITEAWSDINSSVIISGFKTLFGSSAKLNVNHHFNHLDSDGIIPLPSPQFQPV